jgi:hypothetical protein
MYIMWDPAKGPDTDSSGCKAVGGQMEWQPALLPRDQDLARPGSWQRCRRAMSARHGTGFARADDRQGCAGRRVYRQLAHVEMSAVTRRPSIRPFAHPAGGNVPASATARRIAPTRYAQAGSISANFRTLIAIVARSCWISSSRAFGCTPDITIPMRLAAVSLASSSGGVGRAKT